MKNIVGNRRIANEEALILLIGGLVSLLVMVIGYFVYSGAIDQQHSHHEVEVTNDLGGVRSEVSTRFSALRTALTGVSEYVQHYRKMAPHRPLNESVLLDSSYLRRVASSLRNIRTVILIDSKGKIIDDTREGGPGIGIDVSDRGYFAHHAAGPASGFFLGQPVVSRVNGQLSWVLSQAVRDPVGRLYAVVGISLDQNYLKDLFAGTFSEGNGGLVLVHNGTVLSASEPMKAWVGQVWGTLELKSNEPDSFSVNRGISLDGMDGLYTVWSAGLTQWNLTLSYFESDQVLGKNAAARSGPVLWVFALLLLAVAGATIASFIVFRRITAKTRDLNVALGELEEAERVGKLGHLEIDMSSGRERWSEGLLKLVDPAGIWNSKPQGNFWDRIHPQDRGRVDSWAERGISGEQGSLPVNRFRLRHVDGSYFRVDSIGQYQLADGKGPQLILTLHDISMRESERLDLKRYVEVSGNLFVAMDLNGGVTRISEKTIELLGLSRSDIVGQSWIETVVGSQDQEKLRERHKGAFSSQDAERLAGEIEYEVVTKSGSTRVVRWFETLETDRNGYPVELIAFGSDITDVEELELRMSSWANQLPGGMFEYRLYPDGTDQVLMANTGLADLYEVPVNEIEADPTSIWKLVFPEDLGEMTQSVKNSAETLTEWRHEWRARVPSGKVKWMRGMATPKRLSNGTVVWHTLVFDITEEKAQGDQLMSALKKTIDVLSSAVEIRDPYTAGHEKRVAEIARLIGQELEFSEDRLEGLFLAAKIHDIGKIQIPAEILSKPIRLSDIEMNLIRTHSAIGASLLDGIDFRWPIAKIIRQHHERIDGHGYPDGLKGDEILLEARILGVADTIEAMASHRPYRASLGIDVAADEIRKGSGIRYDASVAEAALKLIEEGKVQAQLDG